MIEIKCNCGHIGPAMSFEPGPTARKKAMWQCPKCKIDITQDEIIGIGEISCTTSARPNDVHQKEKASKNRAKMEAASGFEAENSYKMDRK